MSYNGSSDYTDLATNVGNYVLSDSFTLEAWINRALDSANRAIYGNAYALAGYLLRVNTANKARFVVITNGSNFSGRDSSGLTAGWHHVVAVWNGSGTSHVYIDGVLDDAATVSGGSVTTITTSAHTRIGATPESGFASYFNGSIDEVRSSQVALHELLHFAGLESGYSDPQLAKAAANLLKRTDAPIRRADETDKQWIDRNSGYFDSRLRENCPNLGVNY